MTLQSVLALYSAGLPHVLINFITQPSCNQSQTQTQWDLSGGKQILQRQMPCSHSCPVSARASRLAAMRASFCALLLMGRSLLRVLDIARASLFAALSRCRVCSFKSWVGCGVAEVLHAVGWQGSPLPWRILLPPTPCDEPPSYPALHASSQQVYLQQGAV